MTWTGPRCTQCDAPINAWGRVCADCQLNDEKEEPNGPQ